MKRRKNASTWALLALCVMAVAVIAAKRDVQLTEVTKSTGGSTGDSVTAAADTSTWVRLKDGYDEFRVVCMGDSAMRYTVQVSPDTTHWYTVLAESISAGEVELSSDLGDAYNGFAVRIIQDMIPAGGADFGRTTIVQIR